MSVKNSEKTLEMKGNKGKRILALISDIDMVYCIMALSLWVKNLVFLREIDGQSIFSSIMSAERNLKASLIIMAIVIVISLIYVYKGKDRKRNIRFCAFLIVSVAVMEGIFIYKKYFILFMPFAAVCMAISLFFTKRYRVIAECIIDTVLSFSILLDIVTFRAYGMLFSIEYIFNMNRIGFGGRNLIGYMKPWDIIYFLDIIIVLIVYIRNKKLWIDRRKSILKNACEAVVIIILCSIWIYGIYYFFDEKDITNGAVTFFTPRDWTRKGVAERTSSTGYHFWEVRQKIILGRNEKLSSSDKDEIEEWFYENDENLPDNSYASSMKGKNVIFIQVESLENFVINEEAFGQEITPNLNKMLKNSYYFNNIYDQSMYNSADGDFMAHTSIFPLSKESAYMTYPFNTYNTVDKVFLNAGYDTIAVHPEDGGNWNWRDNYSGFGINKIYDNKDFILGLDTVASEVISDESLYKQTVEKLKEETSPFFMHLITLDSHGPFYINERKKQLKFEKTFDSNVLGRYFQIINYDDKSIGELVKYLNEAGLMDDTVLVIYGDHAGPHRYYQDEIDGLSGIKESWKKNDQMIPLIIYNPSIKGETINTIGGQIDIDPTVAYLCGIDKNKYINSFMGRNLFNTERNFTAVFATGTLKSRDLKIIGTPNTEKSEEHMKRILDISNKVIEGNYFKGKY